ATQLREELQQFHLELQQETQEFLLNTSLERQIEAEQLFKQLSSFTQALHEQTTQLISLMAAERALMAQQLFQDLSEFHANLTTSVILLRQNLQQRMQQLRVGVKQLQLETHKQLQAYQQERIRQQMQLMQDLSDWMASLQSEVQTYLSEVELARQERKQHLHQMFQQERSRRADEMQQLFQELTDFRSELKSYRTNLHKMVWGESIVPQTGNTGSEQIKSVVMAKPGKTSPEITIPVRAVRSKPVQSIPKGQSAKPETAKSGVFKSLPASPSAAPSVISNQVPTTTAHNVTPNKVPVMSNQSTPQGALKDMSQLEGEVYKLIRQHHGARLSEIETALNLNRFQAVDALRNLIKKRLITQRDRTYLIQEEVSL
ncbi:MAG TPA: hypothetical protein V6C65_16630, partial [Allocoleopsis sp.]